MDKSKLIGKWVTNKRTGQRGKIIRIDDNLLYVDADGTTVKYSYPAAFNTTLVLDDKALQWEMTSSGSEAEFENFKNIYREAIDQEVAFLKKTGGKVYYAFDGVRLKGYGNGNVYTFDTDTEFHFPDGTGIKIIDGKGSIKGYVISCDEYTIMLQSTKYLGKQVDQIAFQTDQSMLLAAVNDRLDDMDQERNVIAYEVACKGESKIEKLSEICCGQEAAVQHALSKPVTFIWGPPGTGKTYTLATIAMEFIEEGKRVLMLSYSNVSVDGALLQVASRSDYEPGTLLRYGYPRDEEIRNSETLASYRYVMAKNPDLTSRYDSLLKERKQTDSKSERYLELTKQLQHITDSLAEKEKEAIQSASFVATTVSKALMDKAIYNQKFDLVIFDEASMAYVPQVVFAAGLAKQSFVCLGDFRQLPSIVQSSNDKLQKDIFQHTGIAEAVDDDCGHEWLIMLDEQRRMHPDIAKVVSENFYNGKLKTNPDSVEENEQIAKIPPASGQAMAMVDLSGMYSICVKSGDTSRVNILSAMVCVRLATKYCEMYHDQVGIITPYNAQSSFISAMLRDLKKEDPKYEGISCATVHQFQGSEESVIIYDAVDCYLMPYPGTLLTAQKDEMADRLFNVAMTRAKGKFILVANKDYLEKKKISKNLLFTKVMTKLVENNAVIQGRNALKELRSTAKSSAIMDFSNQKLSWGQYLEDLSSAKKEIRIEAPNKMTDDKYALDKLTQTLQQAGGNNIPVNIRRSLDAVLPNEFLKLGTNTGYVTSPVTIIDNTIAWFGQPLAANDFISEGVPIKTEYFPTVRFCGSQTIKSIKSILGFR